MNAAKLAARPQRLISLATAATVLLTVVACGGASKTNRRSQAADEPAFRCRDRHVDYMVIGGMAAKEASVVVDCAPDGPRLRTWQVINNAGDRQESSHSLTNGEFEAIWEKIDSTGWRNLSGDCGNSEAAATDPAYTIVVQQDDLSIEMTCTGRTLPFPHNTFIDELDLLAAEKR